MHSILLPSDKFAIFRKKSEQIFWICCVCPVSFVHRYPYADITLECSRTKWIHSVPFAFQVTSQKIFFEFSRAMGITIFTKSVLISMLLSLTVYCLHFSCNIYILHLLQLAKGEWKLSYLPIRLIRTARSKCTYKQIRRRIERQGSCSYSCRPFYCLQQQ